MCLSEANHHLDSKTFSTTDDYEPTHKWVRWSVALIPPILIWWNVCGFYSPFPPFYSVLVAPSRVLKRYQAPPRRCLSYREMLAGDGDISGACWPIGLRILHFHKQELHIHIQALIYIHPRGWFLPTPSGHCCPPPHQCSVLSKVRPVSLSSSSSSSSCSSRLRAAERSVFQEC